MRLTSEDMHVNNDMTHIVNSNNMPNGDNPKSENSENSFENKDAENTAKHKDIEIGDAERTGNESGENTKEEVKNAELHNTGMNVTNRNAAGGTTDLALLLEGPVEAGHYENFEYIITASNNGPDGADGATFDVLAFSGAENLSMACEVITGNAICPEEDNITIQEMNISTTIPTFANNSVLKFRVKGRYMYIPPTSVKMESRISVPTGMSELNEETNIAITNTKLNILPADVGIESEIESTLQVTHKEFEPGNYVETLFFDDNGKIIQRTTITNHGPGIVKNVPIRSVITIGHDRYHDVRGWYHDLKITCNAQNGAECPASINTTSSSGQMHSYNGGFELYYTLNDSSQSIPFLPVGGSVIIEAEVKFSKMHYNSGGGCGDEIVPIKIIKNYAYIPRTPLRDPDNSNNSIENRPNILIGETERVPCNKIDIRVIEYTNSHSGSIATTTIYPSGKTMPDLIVDNPEEIVYTVAWTNSGADTTHPVTISNHFDISDHYWMHYKNVHISCEAIGMDCPEESELNGENSANFTSSLVRGNNEEQAIFIKTGGNDASYLHHSLISYKTHFPSGANIKFTIKFTPIKFTPNQHNNDDEKCGTSKLSINLELKGVYFFINSHVKQREVKSRLNTFRRIDLKYAPFSHNYLYAPIQQVGVTQFGVVERQACPGVDLAITDIQGFSGHLDGYVVENRDNWAKEFIVNNPQELTFSATYVNSGSHHANNSWIGWKNWNNFKNAVEVEVFDVTLECEGINMKCPDMTNSKGIHKVIKNGEGTLQMDKYGYYPSIFWMPVLDWPAGGRMIYTLKLKVRKVAPEYNACSINPEIYPSTFKFGFLHNIDKASGIIEINEANGGSRGKYFSNGHLHPRTPNGETFGQIRCETGDLSVQVENSTDLMEFDNIFTQTITYRNDGDSIMNNAEILNYWNSLSGLGINVVRVPFEDYTIICETTNGAQCPDMNNLFSEKIRQQKSGISFQDASPQRFHAHYTQTHHNLLHYWTTIPSMPPGSTVKFTIQYKNKKPLQPEFPNCGMNEKLTWSNGYAEIRANRAQYQESNTSNNVSNYIINNYYCIDLWSNTSLDKAKPAPNDPLTMSIRIGNAGQATATGTLFSMVIPAGFRNFDPNAIQCQASMGSPCEIPSFDSNTRVLSSVIEALKKDEVITYTITGQAIDYSSSWETNSVLIEGRGMYERIPNTNKETFSFVVEGVDPTVTKIANIHQATAGDEALYTITVKNPTQGSRLIQSRVEDILPHAFEYVSTERVAMNGGTVFDGNIHTGSTQIPEVELLSTGETKLSWGTFTVPSGGSVVIQFKVRVKEHFVCQNTPFHNSATFYYTTEGTGISDARSYQGELTGLDQDDILIECTPIDAVEDFLTVTGVETGGGVSQGLSHTSLSIIANDTLSGSVITMNGGNTSLEGVTVEEIGIDAFITHNGSGNTVMKEEVYNLFSGSLMNAGMLGSGSSANAFIINNVLIGKVFNVNTGILSWSEMAYTGNYLFAYKLCDKQNILNCDIAPVLVIITRDPQSVKIVAQDDIHSYVRNEDVSLKKQVINVLQNDSYSLPNDTRTTIIPDKDSVIIRLDNFVNGSYNIDNTEREEGGEKVVATIIAGSGSTEFPLIGSYITENGNFIIPENTAPAGDYVIPYTICTKIGNSNIKDECTSANIRVNIAVNAVAKMGTITPKDDIISQEYHSGEKTGTGRLFILGNDTFTTPDELGEEKSANTNDTTFILKAVDNGGNEDYDVDTTQRVENDDTIIATITGMYPLAGSYLTNEGIFVIPPHSAHAGTYIFTYTLCTKEVPGKIISVCQDATIRVVVNIIAPPPSPLPNITIEANDDTINLHRTYSGETTEVNMKILENDILHHETNGKRTPTILESWVNIGNISLTGGMLEGGDTFRIPAGQYSSGVHTIPYTLCTKKADMVTDVCDSANILIRVTVDAPLPPTPSTPTPPSSGGGGGGGGGGGDNPPTPIPNIPIIPGYHIPPKEPLFSAPVIDGKCVSAVKNLDDPKLLAYYDDLKVQDRINVHRAISRIEFIKLVLHSAQIDLSQEDVSHISFFADIDIDTWYAPYVAYMIRTETMHGQEIEDEDDNIIKIFRPNDGITRAEASKILTELTRKTNQKLPSIEEIVTFADIDAYDSLSPYVQYAYNSCLLHGRKTIDGEPLPGEPRVFEGWDGITLAETAKVLYNITHYTEGKMIESLFHTTFAQSLFLNYTDRMRK